MTRPASGALPLGDLLAVLRGRGLPIGVREHLAARRLLEGWQGLDPDGFRAALAAVLARDAKEVRLVRETFDELYRPAPASLPEPPPPLRRPAVRRPWGTVAALALILFVIAQSLAKEEPSPVVVPPVSGAPSTSAALESAYRDVPPPPRISETFSTKDWQRALPVAAGLALLVLLWLYEIRLRREARGLARRLWRRELDALPQPSSYRLDLDRIAPALAAPAIDQVARLLVRAPAPPKKDDLDVDRTVEATLRAGGALQAVLRQRSSPRQLLVLEDTAGEMRPWRRSVSQLLSGLAARGVALDVWRFHANAGRVSRGPGRDAMSLEQLARRRAGSPLLVISAGEGLRTGRDGHVADWAGTLQAWSRRAWLHPVTDPSYWRPQLRHTGTPVFPLTSGGVIAAVRHLADVPSPLRALFPLFPDRPVTPLDVDRLRWLLSLAARRDPDLLELLRQRFFPKLPAAALLDALEAAFLPRQPGRWPAPEEVHEFLADLLTAAPPKTGSAAHGYWSLDRALHEIQVPARREQGLRRLQSLAAGPFAGEVEHASRRLRKDSPRELLREIRTRAAEEGLGAAGTEPGSRRWRWPDRFELGAALLSLLLLGWGLGRWFVVREPVERVILYKLEVVAPRGPGPVLLRATRKAGAPATANLFRQDRDLKTVRFSPAFSGAALEPVDRGSWYYLRSWVGSDRHRLAISNSVWVGTLTPAAPARVVVPPKQSEAPSSTPEPSQDHQSKPTEDSANPNRLGTLDGSGGMGGAPTAPVTTDSSQLVNKGEGILAIEGYPDDLPPQLVRVVGSGSSKQYDTGTPWSGGPMSLVPGDYFLVVNGPYQALELARVKVPKGAGTRISLSKASLSQLRKLLVANEKEGPTIRQVSADISTAPRPEPRTVTISIYGSHFDRGAKVDFTSHPSDVSLGDCRVEESIIFCDVEVDFTPFPDYLAGGGEIKVVNPDGRYTTYAVDFETLLIPQL